METGINNKCKAFTSLEQSKKLAEILPIESADMYYQYVLPKSDRVKHNPEIGNPISALEWYNKGYTMSGKEPITMDEYCVPCWSLAALLDVLPEYNLQRTDWGHKTEYKIVVIIDDEDSCASYASKNYDNPFDACYEMIIKLKDKNLL